GPLPGPAGQAFPFLRLPGPRRLRPGRASLQPGPSMQKLFLTVDRMNTAVGHLFAWLIVLLTVLICWEVFSRYALNNPHPWVFDAQMMLYGTLFMMAGAYTLAANGHVRGDI